MNPSKYKTDEAVVRSKNLITSQGPATAIEFALAIVEALYGKEKAQELADPLIFKSDEYYNQEYY